jgi:hypothetical protein
MYSASAQSDVAGSQLNLTVPRFTAKGISITEALRKIRDTIGSQHVMFSLELDPSEGTLKNLNFNFVSTTVGKLLNSIVAQDPKYTFEVMDNMLIHVFPKGAQSDPGDLLNVKVDNLHLQGVEFERVLKYPQYEIPQLQRELYARSRSGGFAGSELSSASMPQINIFVQSGTVRDVLNLVSQQTEVLPGATPTGWIYWFSINPSVPLGGEPHWDIF